MAQVAKTKLMLAGLLAGAVALGTGCTRAEAEASPQDLLQQEDMETQEGLREDEGLPPEEPFDELGTGGAGDAGTPLMENEEGMPYEEGVLEEDEGVLEPGTRDEGLDEPMEEY